MSRRPVAFCAASLAALTLVGAAHAGNPQIAGLQVALRAYGLYRGPIDAIAGPGTVRATRAFQRRKGLAADGRAGPLTRQALGPLGLPLFGRRTLRRGMLGWDVSVLQFLLARRGELVPVYGYFDLATERALRRYQRSRRLSADGIAGPVTLARLGRGRPSLRPGPRPVRAAPIGVRALLELPAPAAAGVSRQRAARARGLAPGARLREAARDLEGDARVRGGRPRPAAARRLVLALDRHGRGRRGLRWRLRVDEHRGREQDRDPDGALAGEAAGQAGEERRPPLERRPDEEVVRGAP